MVKADYEAVKNHNYVSNREFVCGLVEVIGNRIKLNINSEFLTISESENEFRGFFYLALG